MRAPLSRYVWVLACLGRLRFRRGRLVQALLSSPPSSCLVRYVGLRSSFPLPFQGLPAPGQVCVCVCVLVFSLSPHLLLCSPSRVPVKYFSSHLHLHLIFISLSSPYLSHDPGLNCKPRFAVRVCVCVCVEHLNRCKTSHRSYQSRGAQKAHRAVPNEALYGVLRISRLITWTYLQFSYFPSHGNRLSLQPDTGFCCCTAFAIWRLFLFWLFGSLFVHSCPFQNAELWMYYSNLDFISPFIFTSWTSRGVRRRGLFIIKN